MNIAIILFSLFIIRYIYIIYNLITDRNKLKDNYKNAYLNHLKSRYRNK